MLLRTNGDYPRSHDLDYLRNLLPESWEIHQRLPSLGALTEWIVEARYPGVWPDATESDALEAIQEASAVLDTLGEDWQRHSGGGA